MSSTVDSDEDDMTYESSQETPSLHQPLPSPRTSSSSKIHSQQLSDSSSNFGDEECGEQQLPQQLLLDFTPGDEDDEEHQLKVCAFWDFIRSNPELFGDSLQDMDELEPDVEVDDLKQEESLHEQPLGRTAVSMLQIVDDNNAIDQALEGEVCRSMCDLGDREYIENAPTTADLRAFKIAAEAGDGVLHSSYDVQVMCKDLQQWTLQHLKSMDPPGHISDSEI